MGKNDLPPPSSHYASKLLNLLVYILGITSLLDSNLLSSMMTINNRQRQEAMMEKELFITISYRFPSSASWPLSTSRREVEIIMLDGDDIIDRFIKIIM